MSSSDTWSRPSTLLSNTGNSKCCIFASPRFADLVWCVSVTDGIKAMHTEMSLHPDEFDYFGVGVASDITFCLKELRVTWLFLEFNLILSHENIIIIHISIRKRAA